MARRHVMHEVEEKGWDHTKPHRAEKASIKLFKGANVESTPAVVESAPVVQVAEPVAPQPKVIEPEIQQEKKPKFKKLKDTEIKADVPPVDE